MAVTRLGLFGTARQAYNPSVGFAHPFVLFSVSVESASELTTPVITQEHILLSTSIEGASELTVPSFGQIHILVNTSIQSLSEFTLPLISGWVVTLPQTDQGSSWSGLSETQTPSWTNITETQTASWTDVDDSQP